MIRRSNRNAVKAKHIISKCLADQRSERYWLQGGEGALAIRYGFEKSDTTTEKSQRNTAKTVILSVAIGMHDIDEIIESKQPYVPVTPTTNDLTAKALYDSQLEEFNRFQITFDRVLKASNFIYPQCVMGSSGYWIVGVEEVQGDMITEVMHAKIGEKIPHKKNIQFVAKKHYKYKLSVGNQETYLILAVDKENEMAFLKTEAKFSDNQVFANECILIFNAMPKLSVGIIQKRYPEIKNSTEILSSNLTSIIQNFDGKVAAMKEKASNTPKLILEDTPYSDQYHPTLFHFRYRFPRYRYYAIEKGGVSTNEFVEDQHTHSLATCLFDIQRLHHTFASLRAVAAALIRELVESYGTITTDAINDYIEEMVHTTYEKTFRTQNVNILHEMPLQTEIDRVSILSELVGVLFQSVYFALKVEYPTALEQLKRLLWKGVGFGEDNLPPDNAPTANNINFFGHALAVHFFETNAAGSKKPMQFPYISDAHDSLFSMSSGHKWIVRFTLDVKSLCYIDLEKILQSKDHSWFDKYTLYDEHPDTKDKTMRKMKYFIAVRYNKQQRYKFVIHQSYTHLEGTA